MMTQILRHFLAAPERSSGYKRLPSCTKTTAKLRPSKDRKPKAARHSSKSRLGAAPLGHFPVNVAKEMKRFVVSAKFLSHPIVVELLNKSSEEYGYDQPGVLKIPCTVVVFERVLEMLGDGRESSVDVDEIPSLISEV